MTTPSAFEGFDQLEGLDILDKADLVGKPFGITAIRFRTNEREVAFAEAEIVTANGEVAAINDSSTGVRDQLAAYMVAKGHEHSANTEWVETKLFVPRGLRVSQYEVQVNGQPKKAKTYYLTTSGRHTATPAADRSKGRKVAA